MQRLSKRSVRVRTVQQGDATADQHPGAAAACELDELGREPALPDAGVTAQDEPAGRAGGGQLPVPEQQLALAGAPDERRALALLPRECLHGFPTIRHLARLRIV